MGETLTIWCNAQLEASAMEELQAGCAGHRLVMAGQATSNLGSGLKSPELVGADVAFGQPDPEQVIELDSLRWVQITSAGYTRYDRADVKSALEGRGGQFSNCSSVFDEPCSQHLLAFMLAHARRLPWAIENQITNRHWKFDELRPASRVLENETVLVLGYGAIARRLIQLLAPFSLNVIALRRKVSGDEVIPTYAESELDGLLPTAHHVVSTLPANPGTAKMMNSDRFGRLQVGAVFYNVGRGTTVDQTALMEALSSGRLAGAYLDVTDPEPLPTDNPLWKAPNCWITPHVAGGRQDEDLLIVRHFLGNLRRFEANEKLVDRVF